MAYGDKQDHRRVSIYGNGVFIMSTRKAATCKEAKAYYCNRYNAPTHKVEAIFSNK